MVENIYNSQFKYQCTPPNLSFSILSDSVIVCMQSLLLFLLIIKWLFERQDVDCSRKENHLYNYRFVTNWRPGNY